MSSYHPAFCLYNVVTSLFRGAMAATVVLGLIPCLGAQGKSPTARKYQVSSKMSVDQAVDKLKEKGIIQNAQDVRSSKGGDVMRRAIIYSKPAILRTMLAAGADAQAHDVFGKPLLALAVEFADPPCTKALLSAGAQVESLPAESLAWLGFQTSQQPKVVQTIRLLLKDEVGFRKLQQRWQQSKEGQEVREMFRDIMRRAINGAWEGSGKESLADRLSLLIHAGADAASVGEVARRLAQMPDAAKAMKVLLDAGLDPETTSYQLTMLQAAAKSGSADTMKYLIEAGANVHVVDKATGETPLMMVAKRDADRYYQWWTSNRLEERGEMVRLLLAAGADPSAKDKEGKTALQLLEEFRCQHPYVDALPSWRQGCEQAWQLLQAAGNKGEMGKLLSKSLPTKVKRQHYGAYVSDGEKERWVPSLSKAEARKLLKHAGQGGEQALFAVVTMGDVEGLELLLAAGAKVAGVRVNGGARTLLTSAIADAYNPEVVRLLLAAGADAREAGQDGRSPIHLAAQQGLTDCLQLLLKAGADVQAADKEGRLPVHLAAQQGSVDCLQLLLRSGVDVDAPTKEQKTALELACGAKSAECIQLLLKAGAKPQKDAFPYLQAVVSSPECLRLLIGAGISLQEEVGQGKPPLLAVAAGSGAVESVRLLLQAGANPNLISDAKRVNQESSLNRALEALSSKSLKVLLDAGADVAFHESQGVLLLYNAASEFRYQEDEDLVVCVRLCIAAGADIQKGSGATLPIHAAAYRGVPRVLKLLLDAGADVFARDGSGKTPRQLVEEEVERVQGYSLSPFEKNRYNQCLKLLREAESQQKNP